MPFGLSSLINYSLNKSMAKEISRTMIRLANTAHQREVKDLRKAGLNPILSTGGSGASTPNLPMAEANIDFSSGTSQLAKTYFDGFSAQSQAEKNLADIGVAQAQKEQITTAAQGQRLENINKPIRQRLENASLQHDIDLKISGRRVADANYKKNMAEAKSIAEDVERKAFENDFLHSDEGRRNYSDRMRLAATAPNTFMAAFSSAKEAAEEIRKSAKDPNAEREIREAIKSGKSRSDRARNLRNSRHYKDFDTRVKLFDPHGERMFRGW